MGFNGDHPRRHLRYPMQYCPFLPSSQLKLVHAVQYSMHMRKTLPIRCVNYFRFHSIPFCSVPGFIPSQSCQEQILRVTEVFLLSSAMFGCCTTVAPWYTLIIHPLKLAPLKEQVGCCCFCCKFINMTLCCIGLN